MRVELEPDALFQYGIGLEDVRAALAAANANSPKGAIEDDDFHYQIYANDQATQGRRSIATSSSPIATARRCSSATSPKSSIRSRTCATPASSNGKPSVGDRAVAPARRQHHPGGRRREGGAAAARRVAAGRRRSHVVVDRSITIRGSLADTERTLVISVALVILVVFAFLRNVRAAAIPSVAVPVSIIGSFGAMYLLGFSLDNLSLMALTISTGFVVDDAIVVLENVTRHIEGGTTRMQAAIVGAREVGFTVISISLSLIAVFLPLLLMGGIVGRLFREFALTLSMAVLISLVVSLTTTPMMCALSPAAGAAQPATAGSIASTERGFDAMLAFYRVTLGEALRHPLLVVLVLVGDDRAQCLPVQSDDLQPVPGAGHRAADRLDPGRPEHLVPVDEAEARAVAADRAGRSRPSPCDGLHRRSAGQFRLRLHFAETFRRAQRHAPTAWWRGCAASSPRLPGARLFLVAVSDLRTGGRQSNAAYQYTLLSDDTPSSTIGRRG